jgi:hypothetical protein
MHAAGAGPPIRSPQAPLAKLVQPGDRWYVGGACWHRASWLLPAAALHSKPMGQQAAAGAGKGSAAASQRSPAAST